MRQLRMWQPPADSPPYSSNCTLPNTAPLPQPLHSVTALVPPPPHTHTNCSQTHTLHQPPASWICDGLMMLWMAGAGEEGLRKTGAVISCPAGDGVVALSPCGSPQRHLSTSTDPGIGLLRGAKRWRDRSVQSALPNLLLPNFTHEAGPKSPSGRPNRALI